MKTAAPAPAPATLPPSPTTPVSPRTSLGGTVSSQLGASVADVARGIDAWQRSDTKLTLNTIGAASASAAAALHGVDQLGWSPATSSTVRNAGHGIKSLVEAQRMLGKPTTYTHPRILEQLTEARTRLSLAEGSVKLDLRRSHTPPAYYPGEKPASAGVPDTIHGGDSLTGGTPRATYDSEGEVMYPGGGSGEFSTGDLLH